MATGSNDPRGSAERGTYSPAASTGSARQWIRVYMDERWYEVDNADVRPAGTADTQRGWVRDRGYVGVATTGRDQWEEVSSNGWGNFRATTGNPERSANGNSDRPRLNIPPHDGPTAVPQAKARPAAQPKAQPTPPNPQPTPQGPPEARASQATNHQDDEYVEEHQSQHSYHSNSHHSANSRHSNAHQSANSKEGRSWGELEKL